MNCIGNQVVLYADAAIRIDDVNPAGVYFFIHALTTYRRLHDMYSATFKRKPNVGVGHDLPNHLSLQSRFIAYSGSIRRESGRGFPYGPERCEQGSRDT